MCYCPHLSETGRSMGAVSTVEVHGPALRVIREARGLAAKHLAERAQISESYVRSIERGDRTTVSAALYARMLHELDVADYRALLLRPTKGDA